MIFSLALPDEFAQLREFGAAWTHEEITIADTRPAGSQPDAAADDPEKGSQNTPATEILDCPRRRPI
ncbi:hypothetical protein [Bradyrhizobium sp. AS23.2]|uniref:hypothetical protein n=1 Tax=Bradyrhizobium sp. AS23.2 TaxID=1680155 RepID=UPI00093E381C|nr:hypothetical protein [Bradyrhizobium sp. AS23.2]OKO84740.1 hypothetical protein AC630_08040 [Bradyrhizobium sp. AS23.2]